MASLPPLTGYNLGGIDQFWFIPVDDVHRIPDEEINVIEQDIQLLGDAKFSVGYATQETLQFTENQNRDAQGNFYEQSLSGFYPKDQENIASLFEGMAAERFIVIFRDNNGYYKLLGSLANPCKFTATFESGDSANGRNGYSFEFTRTDVEKAPFYRGIINETEKVINTDPCAGLEKPVRQTYTLTFEANSAKYNALTIEQQGTIQLIDAPSGTTVYKSTSSSPYQAQIATGDSVDEGDIVTVELSSEPTSKETVEIVVSYSNVGISKVLPESIGNGRYGVIRDFSNQVIRIIDFSTHTINHNISLPTGYNFKGSDYRDADQSLYVFGNEQFVRIDLNNSNGTFASIVEQKSFNVSNGKFVVWAEYDGLRDQFYCAFEDNGGRGLNNFMAYFDPTSQSFTDFPISDFQYNFRGGFGRMNYDCYGDNLCIKGMFEILNLQTFQLLDFKGDLHRYGSHSLEQLFFNPVNSLYYLIAGQTLKICRVQGIFLPRVAKIGKNNLSICKWSIKKQEVLIKDDSSGTHKFFDMASNTTIGTEQPVTNECVNELYSSYSNNFYSRDLTNNDILYFDVSSSVGSRYKGKISNSGGELICSNEKKYR